MKNYCLLIFACLQFIIACKTKEQPVTKPEAIAFAKIIDSSISTKNAALFNSFFDLNSMSNKVAKEADSKLNSAILKGLKKGFVSANIGGQIIASLSEKGTFELVKQYEKENIQHLIFRLYDNGMNYYDFELVKKNGKVNIADAYIYLTGETLSKTFADLLVANLDGGNKRLDEMKSFKTIKAMLLNNDSKKALELYNKLSPEMKKLKTAKLYKIQITAAINNNIYLEAIEDYKTSFPNEPNIYFILIDKYFIDEDYDNVIYCVNKVDSFINKDPFFDYYRGLVYKMKEDRKTALTYFEKAFKNIPTFDDNVIELISFYAEDGNFVKAKQLITDYKNNKKRKQEKLENIYTLYPNLELDK